MAAGIDKNIDYGYVEGNTWHRNPQYIRLDRPVTIQEALEVLPNTYEIHPAYGRILNSNGVKVFGRLKKANYVYWPEKNVVVAENIGNRFNLLNVDDIVRWTESAILEPYPDMTIESCGTLNSGSIRFISIVAGRLHIKGDESPHSHRMMITDPIGAGSIKIVDSMVRVVCANTHAFALSNANREGSIVNVRHSASVNDNVKIAALEMGERLTAFRNEKAKLDLLADTGITVAEVDRVLETVFPAHGQDGDWLKGTKNKRKHEKIKHIFEGGQQWFMAGYDRSACAFFNSITQYLRDEPVKNGKSIEYDNIAGAKAAKKNLALDALLQLV